MIFRPTYTSGKGINSEVRFNGLYNRINYVLEHISSQNGKYSIFPPMNISTGIKGFFIVRYMRVCKITGILPLGLNMGKCVTFNLRYLQSVYHLHGSFDYLNRQCVVSMVSLQRFVIYGRQLHGIFSFYVIMQLHRYCLSELLFLRYLKSFS